MAYGMSTQSLFTLFLPSTRLDICRAFHVQHALLPHFPPLSRITARERLQYAPVRFDGGPAPHQPLFLSSPQRAFPQRALLLGRTRMEDLIC